MIFSASAVVVGALICCDKEATAVHDTSAVANAASADAASSTTSPH